MEINTITDNDCETICPYCGEADEWDSESLTWSDSENSEMKCSECGKEYEVSCYVSYLRESHKKED